MNKEVKPTFNKTEKQHQAIRLMTQHKIVLLEGG
jgi:hypothetical protein